MKIQEKKGNNEQMQNINKDKLATSLNEKATQANEDLQISTTQQEKQSFDAMDNIQEHSNYAEQVSEQTSNLQPNGLVKGKAKTILPDYAPSVEYLKSKMRGEDGKFRMLPSSDIELWIKAVHNSGEIDENKWELIKLLNKMHIFSLADEYEKEDKLKEEQDKNWLEPKGENKITQGFGDLKVVERENEEKEKIKNYEPPTMYFGNGKIKTGDTVIQDPHAPIEKDDSKIQSVNYDKVQVDGGTLGKKEDQSVVNTSTNQQGFGAFKSVENYSSEKKDSQNYEQNEQYRELKDAATNILKGLGKEVTQQSIKDAVDILQTNSDKNAIVEAGSFIAKADLVYINAGISSSALAKVLPISDKIKEYLSLGVNFVYIKSLDDCYILAGAGAGKTTGASISFMHLPDEIKQLQQQLYRETNENRKNDLKVNIKRKTEDIINGSSVEASFVAGVGFKTIWLKDGRSVSGFSIGAGGGLAYGYSYGKSERDKMQEKLEKIKERNVVID